MSETLDIKTTLIGQVGGHPIHEFTVLASREHAKDVRATATDNIAYDDGGWHHEALAAYLKDSKGRVTWIGVISFTISKWNRTMDLGYSYVHPKYRRQGVHTALFEHAKSEARKRGMVKIGRTVALKNSAMQASVKAQGCVPVTQKYVYSLYDGENQFPVDDKLTKGSDND